MKKTLWEYIQIVKEHFSSHADVVGMSVTIMGSKSTCAVTVKNAAGRLVTWEHVETGVRGGEWINYKHSTPSVDEPIPYVPAPNVDELTLMQGLVHRPGEPFESCVSRGLRQAKDDESS